MIIQTIIYILQIMAAADLLILAVWLLERLFYFHAGHLWRKWLWLFLCLFMIFPYQIHGSNFDERWKGIRLEIEINQPDTAEALMETDPAAFEQETAAAPVNEAVQSYDAADSQETAAEDFGENYETAMEDTKRQEAVAEDSDGKQQETSLATMIQKLSAFLRAHILTIAAVVWVAGFALTLMYHLLQYFYVRELYLEDAVICENKELLNLEAYWGEKYRLKKLPKLMEKKDVRTPLVFGYINTILVFPPEVYFLEEMSMIMQHELMHQKHLDAWYKLLILLVCDLYWFNPVLRLMKRMAFQDVEYVCDERVTKSMLPEQLQQYGATILKTVRANPKKPVPSALQFAVNKKAVKDRLGNLFTAKNQKKGMLLLPAALLVLILCTAGVRISISTAPEQEIVVLNGYAENHFYNRAVKHYGEYIYYSAMDGIFRTKDCKDYEQVYRFTYPASTDLCLSGSRLYFAECRNEASAINREDGKMYKPDTLLCMDLHTLETGVYQNI